MGLDLVHKDFLNGSNTFNKAPWVWRHCVCAVGTLTLYHVGAELLLGGNIIVLFLLRAAGMEHLGCDLERGCSV